MPLYDTLLKWFMGYIRRYAQYIYVFNIAFQFNTVTKKRYDAYTKPGSWDDTKGNHLCVSCNGHILHDFNICTILKVLSKMITWLKLCKNRMS